jgi:immunity protein, SdpI family
MKTDWRAEIPQLAILAAMFILAVMAWPSAPDRLPVHWNWAGEVDRYGGRFEGLLLMPLIATGVYLLLLFAPRIDPGRANYPGFRGTYVFIRTAVLAVMAGLYVLVHLSIRGRSVDMQSAVPALISGLFIAIGATMGKLRPNWFLGLRTPWTLSSKTAWVRTHRIGGWLFILLGLSMVLATPLTDGPFAAKLLVFGAAGIAAWSMVYSYVIWRSDPDKVPPAGTTPGE